MSEPLIMTKCRPCKGTGRIVTNEKRLTPFSVRVAYADCAACQGRGCVAKESAVEPPALAPPAATMADLAARLGGDG